MINIKRIISLFLFAFVLFIFPLKTFAYVKVESGPVINTFSLAAPVVNYNVTFEYYYVDENGIEHVAQSPVTNTYSSGTVITLNADLITSLDYSSVDYYINNSLYSNPTYTVSSNTTIKEVYNLNTYTITYNLNGGTNNANNPVAYTAESGTITLSAPTRTSATFTGWTWQGQTTPQLNVSFSASDKENKTFTANWQVSTYTLKSGSTFVTSINANYTAVIFGLTSDYPTIAQGNGTHVGATSSDLIYFYVDNNIMYVLSDRVIAFNNNSNQMFYNKTNLTSIQFNNIDTSQVTNMASMFYGTNGLTTLDLSLFDTSNVTNMSGMFQGSSGNSSNLTTVYVSDLWDTSAVTSSSNMFKQARKLVGGNGTTYVNNTTDKTYAKVDEDGSPGYFTYKAYNQ